jgi:nitrogen-specific signal transduction histidine kinase/ActR/RegA family two-component response regulator
MDVVARDSTERRRLEDQLRQAQKMEAVGRLAGGIAHEFNNLLCVITGYSTLAAEGLAEGKPLRRDLAEIVRAADRATSLTRQLLAFSRKQMVVPRVFDLNSLLADLDRLLRRVLGEDVELVLAPAAEPLPIKADHNQLEQVLMNLVVNARDAMPRGGQLTISTADVERDAAALLDHPKAAPGRYVRLVVRDTGCGMDREVLARLFEPFFTTKEPGKGTGLGLATVLGIVDQSGGHVEVSSEPTRGTAFRVYLPRYQPAREAALPPPSVEPNPPGGAETILLVEDEDGVRALAGQTLRQHGYHVLEAADGEEALEVSRRSLEPIHLLLSDVVMPKLGGPVLAERLLPGRPGLKVLFMSGFTDSALVRHGVVSGEVECLFKPFTPTALAAKVREVLDRPVPSPAPS